MLEYCQTENRCLEKPVGRFQPSMFRFWDGLFQLCRQYGLRMLLTPYDTFWMRRRWNYHPYNYQKGGPCRRRTRWLSCPATRQAIKDRLTFTTERWGGRGEAALAEPGDLLIPVPPLSQDLAGIKG